MFFLIFYFDTTLAFFWVQIFNFFYVIMIVLSFQKFIMSSIILLEFIQKIYDDSH
jgi:hypothetical protein